jgi:hypothetical protein
MKLQEALRPLAPADSKEARPVLAKRKSSYATEVSTDGADRPNLQRKRSRTLTTPQLPRPCSARSASTASEQDVGRDARLSIAQQRIDSLKRRIEQLEVRVGELEDENAALTEKHAADVGQLEQEKRALTAEKARLEKHAQEWADIAMNAMTLAGNANAANAALAGTPTPMQPFSDAPSTGVSVGVQPFPDPLPFPQAPLMPPPPELDLSDPTQAQLQAWLG